MFLSRVSLLSLAAISLSGLLLSACTADPGDDPSGLDGKADKAGGPAGIGEDCGTDVVIQRDCAEGLTCVFPEGGPITEHAVGTCQHVAELGEDCGSDVAIQTECAEGLTCVFPEGGPITEHAVGTCQDVAALGEDCGTDVAIHRDCAPGLTCVFPEGGPITEHAVGTCEMP